MVSNESGTDHTGTYPIAIVGGGLGGLAVAVGLIKHGINVHIFEAAQKFSQVGAGVAFGPNSVKALSLIDEALLEGYKRYATFNEDPIYDSSFICLRWGMDERRENGKKAGDLMGHIEDERHDEIAKGLGVKTRSCIHRARLLDVLVSLIPEKITSFGKEFERVEEQPDGTLKLYFADGSTAMASAVIGCDGIKSKVRKVVCGPNTEPGYQKEYALRAVVPRSEAESVLGSDLTANGQLYCGYNAYIVTYPIEQGSLINMVAIPCETGEPSTWNDDWIAPATKEDFYRHLEGFYPPVVGLMHEHFLPQKWGMFDVEHDEPYYKNRVCLLGDSAHAGLPHIGGGAGMALEDAYILSNLIAHVQDVGHIERAFIAYDSIRRPRTQQHIKRSRYSGLLVRLMADDIGDDWMALKETLEKSCFNWLWHENLEAQLKHAKALIHY